MKEIERHPNIIGLRHAYFTADEEDSSATILNIVMDLIPMTVNRIIETFRNLEQPLHPILLKLYSY